jgi:hypothetical protein
LYKDEIEWNMKHLIEYKSYGITDIINEQEIKWQINNSLKYINQVMQGV